MYERRYQEVPEQFIDVVEIFTKPEKLELLYEGYLPTGPYHVASDYHFYHKWGSGGFRMKMVALVKGDEQLLFSFYYESWDTTSDDSIDSSGRKDERTFLLKEDPAAQQLFDAIRARHHHAQDQRKART